MAIKKTYAISRSIGLQALVNDLRDGKIHDATDIPRSYIDTNRIVDPQSEQGRAFQDYMESIRVKVAPDHPENVLFLLEDSDEPEAFTFGRFGNPQIVVLSTAMVTPGRSDVSCENEDQLAFIIGHELAHRSFYLEKGRRQNSQEEEHSCDLRAIEGMMNGIEENGRPYYDVNEAVKILYAFSSKNLPLGTLGILDVHGSPQIRADLSKTVVGGDTFRKGIIAQPTPFSPAALDLLENASYTSYLSRFNNAYPDYKKLPVEQKIGILKQEALKLLPEQLEAVDALSSFIKDLSIDIMVPIQRQALTDAIAAVQRHPEALALYPVLSAKTNSRGQSRGLSRTLELPINTAIEDFILAESPEEAAEAAKEVVEFMQRAKPSMNQWLRAQEVPNFEYNSMDVRNQAGPWTKHVKWAAAQIRAGKDKENHLTQMLWYMGITPQLLFEQAPDDLLQKFGHINAFSYPQGIGYENRGFEYLLLETDGRIGALRPHGSFGREDVDETSLDKYENEVMARWRRETRIRQMRQYKREQEEAAKNDPEQAKKISPPVPQPTSGGMPTLLASSAQHVADNIQAYVRRDVLSLQSPWKQRTAMARSMQGESEIHDALEKSPFRLNEDFANELLKKLRTAYKSNPEKYGPKIKEFFLDHDSLYSVPGLLDEYMLGMPVLINARGHAKGELRDADTDRVYRQTIVATTAKLHPLARYALDNPDGLFSQQEQLQFAGEKAKYIPLKYFQKSFAPEKNKQYNFSELKALLEHYNSIGPKQSSYPLQVFAGTTICNYIERTKQPEQLVELLCNYPKYFEFVATDPTHVSATMTQNLSQKINQNVGLIASGLPTFAPYSYFRHSMRGGEMLANNRKVLIDQLQQIEHYPAAPQDLMQMYKTIAAADISPSPEWMQALAARTLTALKEVDNADTRRELCSRFLTDSYIHDAQLRQATAKLWAQAMLEKIGKDPGYEKTQSDAYFAAKTEAEREAALSPYHRELYAMIAPAIQVKNPALRVELLQELAETLQIQREISHDISTNQLALNRDALFELDGRMNIDEAVLSLASSERSTRRATIEFLSKPLSRETIEGYASVLDEQIIKKLELESGKGGPKLDGDSGADYLLGKAKNMLEMAKEELEAYKNSGAQISEVRLEALEQEYLMAKVHYDEILEQSQQYNETLRIAYEGDLKAANQQFSVLSFCENTQQQVKLENMYQNFWTMPMPARIMIIDQLLLSSKEKAEDAAYSKTLRGKNFMEALDYTIKLAITPEMKNGDTMQQLLYTYVMSVDEVQASLFVAATMAAAQKSAQENAGTVDAAKICAEILMSMGVFERKVCQAISNSPDFPDDVRAAFAKAKGEGLKLPRWIDIERIYEVTPPELHREFEHIGERLGGASIYTNYQLDMKNGDDRALGVKEAFAAQKAKKGENTAMLFVENLKKYAPELAEKMPQTMEDILQIAGESTRAELDSENGRVQHEILRNMANGAKVVVDGEEINFSTATLRAYGEDFRLTDRVPGAHVAEMKEELQATPEEEMRIHTARVALVLCQWLGGLEETRGHYDEDDHDYQGKVSRDASGKLTNYGRYDPGGVNTTPRTEAQTRELAESLYRVMSNVIIDGKEIASAFHDEVELQRGQGTDGKAPQHLVASQRLLLAIAPSVEHIGAERLLQIVGDLRNQGKIDPVIDETLTAKLQSPQEQMALFSRFMQAASEGREVSMEKIQVFLSNDAERKPLVIIHEPERAHNLNPPTRYNIAGKGKAVHGTHTASRAAGNDGVDKFAARYV
jgi:hypothetical protein